MRLNRAVIGLTASAIAVGLMVAPVADAGLVNKPNKLVQPKIKQDIKVVPTKGEAVSSPGQKLASDKSVASKSKLSKSKQRLVNSLPKYLSGSPTPANISRLAGKLKRNSQRTSSVRSLDCSGVPANTRCWYYDWIRSAGGSSVMNGRSERRNSKLACGSSSSSDYLTQDNPAFRRNPSGPDVDYRTSNYQLPFMWVDRAAMQIGSNTPDCRFKPAVGFTAPNLNVSTPGNAQSPGNIKITTDYTGTDEDDLPIEDVYLNFPRGMKMNASGVTATGGVFRGELKADQCDAAVNSKVGSINVLMHFFSKDFPYLDIFRNQRTTGSVCVTQIDNATPAPGQRLGILHLYIRSVVAGAQSGDDLAIEVPVTRSSDGTHFKATMLDVPRLKADATLPGLPEIKFGVWIVLRNFEVTFFGNAGGANKLITNPLPSECKDGDRATYSAIHKSWVNDETWIPNPFTGRTPDGLTYLQAVWASGGKYNGCTG